MSQKFSLTIDKPCFEKFEQFKTTGNGGFCNSCQKEVINFTKMSDQEVFQYFKNQDKITCGRFHHSQIKTYSETASAKGKYSFKTIGAWLMSISVLSFLPVSQSHAKNYDHPNVKYITPKKDSKKENTESKVEEKEHVVQGVVVDENNQSLPGVNIVLKGSSIGIITDVDGRFKFPETLKAGDVLIFNFVGYQSQEFIIKENAPDIINIKIEFKEDDLFLMGEVSVNQVYSSKPSVFQKIKALFK
jgi:hypothetical protein